MKLIQTGVLALLLLSACSNGKDGGFQASVIVEGTAVKVPAQTGGILLERRFNEGDQVARGDTLAIVDAEKLSYQHDQLLANRDDLQVQRRLAATNLQKARDEFDYAKTSYERVRDLFQQQATTEQRRDDAKLNYDRSTKALEAAQLSMASIDSKLRALDAQANLLQRQLRDAVTLAPIAGQVTTKYFEPGEMVPPGAPIAELIDLRQMWAKVYVSETMLPNIRYGQSATVSIDGSPQTLSGSVAWISAKAEFTPKNILTEESRTALVYAIKVNIDNPDGILKHGMPVGIRLHN